MGPPEPPLGVVRIEVRVGVAMVNAVRAGPPADGALNRAGAGGGEEELEDWVGGVGAVGPETVVPGGYAYRASQFNNI